MKDWHREDSTHVFECPIFNVRRDSRSSPETGQKYEFFIIEPFDWVNVVAITESGEVVLVEQYRHGVDAVTLEIPGGVIDEGEAPESAARRELLEETGYEADHWKFLGVNEPNPAIQSNRCYTFLADRARLVGSQNLDKTEQIGLRLARLEIIPELIATGKIGHALVIAAFYYYELGKR
jgi:ADP-ribose pyrophosphatase